MQDRLTELHAKIKSTEQRLYVGDPLLHQAFLSSNDEAQALSRLRAKSEAGLESLRQKYGGIQPRGDDVVSIRSLPTIGNDLRKAPTVFRMLIPDQRQVWLKYGVSDTSGSGFSAADFAKELLQQSPFQHTGPYEMLLPAGDHTLAVSFQNPQSGSLPLRVKLNDTNLVDSSFQHEFASHGGGMSVAASEQLDYKDRQLPTLLSAKIVLRDDAGKRLPEGFRLLVWLDDHSSGFEPFPQHK